MFVFPRVRESIPSSIDGWVLPDKLKEDGYEGLRGLILERMSSVANIGVTQRDRSWSSVRHGAEDLF